MIAIELIRRSLITFTHSNQSFMQPPWCIPFRSLVRLITSFLRFSSRVSRVSFDSIRFITTVSRRFHNLRFVVRQNQVWTCFRSESLSMIKVPLLVLAKIKFMILFEMGFPKSPRVLVKMVDYQHTRGPTVGVRT